MHAASATIRNYAQSGDPTLAPVLNILIADDNLDAANTLAELMRVVGHKVEVAYRGDDAAALADEFHPDLAFLDIGMPGMDGLEVCRQIRSRSWSERTVVIAVTGFGLPQDYDASREAGFDYHCTKPITFNTVNNILGPLTAED